MKSFLAGLVCLISGTALSVDALAQAGEEHLGRARIQSLQEMHKPYDVMTTQSVPSAESSKRPATQDDASTVKKSPRPRIIESPSFNKGLSVTPR